MTTKWHGGKGSGSRPFSVTQEEYDNRWDLIFGKDKTTVKESLTDEQEHEEHDLDEDNDDECESEE